ncbi:hypothetical protein G6O69_02115 [Pseudenhygromyxa sp. WMMC2535]|uniref:hypothetical protein n=1 Tax=Pseudenhygromyxa sp. WMMC2535 TaxID=2712867 RepID=UPI0015551DD0|nr:hypothetical protein [Pseudenhygromyxa sp. WMMC2535]NVB36610.1 hypothetical protein [Pseudenhygromyxa sp. WMMC2535]
MNFFAHAVLAARRSESPSWIVGAMAPDFASMAGMRLVGIEDDDELARGVDFHHRSDDAFHGAPIFVELMEDARVELEARGLGFGPAAAIGHVGVELLLDGLLVDRLGVLPSYRAAMAAAAELDQNLRFHDLGRFEGCRRWRTLCGRLRDAPLPESYQAPDFVADRLIWILAKRPRLAVEAGNEPEVFAWAARARGLVDARADALMDQVEARLAAS